MGLKKKEKLFSSLENREEKEKLFLRFLKIERRTRHGNQLLASEREKSGSFLFENFSRSRLLSMSGCCLNLGNFLVRFSNVNLQSVFRLEGVSTLVTLENILKVSSFSFFFRNFLVRLLQQKKQVFSSNSSLLLAFRLTVDGVGFFFFFLVGAELRNVKFFTQINSFQMNLPQGKALKS